MNRGRAKSSHSDHMYKKGLVFYNPLMANTTQIGEIKTNIKAIQSTG